MRYRLSAKADDDLLALLLDGIERFGVQHARGYRKSLESVFDLLADFPELARLRTEVTPPICVLPHRPFLILYEIEEDGSILIQRIRHGRSDWISDPL